MAEKKQAAAAKAPGAVETVALAPLIATGPVADGLARVEILVETAVGRDRVAAGSVVDVEASEALHLCRISKAKPAA